MTTTINEREYIYSKLDQLSENQNKLKHSVIKMEDSLKDIRKDMITNMKDISYYQNLLDKNSSI